jgi:hypothetical protein
VVEILNAALFVQSRTRGPRVPTKGDLFVEPIAHTATECRGYNREEGMTGLGRPELVGLIRFLGESGCLNL